MSAINGDWWRRWGPWFGPTAAVVLLAIVGRIEACNTAKAGEAVYAEANRARIQAVEKRLDGNDRWIEEHGRVATSRIAQLDSLDKLIAVLQVSDAQQKQDITEIKQDLREIRNLLRYRTSRP